MQQDGLFEASIFTRPSDGQHLSCSILVVGGSTAAYSATLGALQAGARVYLVQPQAVVGGQFTTQGLSASDDGALLSQKVGVNQLGGETFAISHSQRTFRARQRELQKVNNQIVDNPGQCWVGYLCTTPVVAATALNEELEDYLAQSQLTLIPFAEPVEVRISDLTPRPRVTGVVFRDIQNQGIFSVDAQVIIEATDLGDLLELGGIESRVGQEARNETGEAVLPETAFPRCQQSITFDVLVERTAPGDGVPIGVPVGYGEKSWLQGFSSTFWRIGNSGTWEPRDFLAPFSIFDYRRVQIGSFNGIGDVSVLNWACQQQGSTGPILCGNDYKVSTLVGVSRTERLQHIQQARDRARAYVHFLQTTGVENLEPRGDLTWTDDGIALEPYIREARRGVALTTVCHQNVAKSFFPGHARATSFEDSVGIGQYHYLDIHPNDEVGHVELLGDDQNALPFTIPLGALIPINTDGLILSSKSIGTTHITNAAYRMHPVEWAIGEAGGYLAALALNEGVEVRDISTSQALKRKLQGLLAHHGVPLFWFNDVAQDDPDFEAIQVLAAAGIMRSESNQNLNFNPQGDVNRAVLCVALVNILDLVLMHPTSPTFTDVPQQHWAYESIETLHAAGLPVGVVNQRFAPDKPATRQQLSILIKKAEQLSVLINNTSSSILNSAFSRTPRDTQKLQRRELSRVLYEVLKVKLNLT